MSDNYSSAIELIKNSNSVLEIDLKVKLNLFQNM